MSQTILPKLLQEAKELNIAHRNCMKTKRELEKTIFETQRKYEEKPSEMTPEHADAQKSFENRLLIVFIRKG